MCSITRRLKDDLKGACRWSSGPRVDLLLGSSVTRVVFNTPDVLGFFLCKQQIGQEYLHTECDDHTVERKGFMAFSLPTNAILT